MDTRAFPTVLPTGPPCRCGHRRTAHMHYRLGTDCAQCRCTHWRRQPDPWAALRRWCRARFL